MLALVEVSPRGRDAVLLKGRLVVLRFFEDQLEAPLDDGRGEVDVSTIVFGRQQLVTPVALGVGDDEEMLDFVANEKVEPPLDRRQRGLREAVDVDRDLYRSPGNFSFGPLAPNARQGQ